jgi:2-polyprenyl-3-methyl-5-hydroxy-6-metoxy-1,4-benzoquinol methylase
MGSGMDELALKERHKYETIWKLVPEYRKDSPADSLTPVFLYSFDGQIQKGETVVDFGCGPGRSALPLLKAGLNVHLIDITEEALDIEIFLQHMKSSLRFTESCLWDLPADLEPAEWILCFDVLEHIPEEKLASVLSGISSRMIKGGLLSIHLIEDQFGQVIGERLHLTIQSADWWKGKISQFFCLHKELFNDGTVLILLVTNGSDVLTGVHMPELKWR